MRKFAVAGIAGAIVVAGATAALAASSWPSLTVKPSVTPGKAGTRAHPAAAKLNVRINWQSLGAANQPIVTAFHILFPKGALYNGAHTTSCSVAKLNAAGPSGCPKASIMGTGTGNAYADTVITHPQITVVNGGASKTYFYTVLNNPARVQTPVVGNISRTGGKWAYKLDVSVPQELQVVAGIPIELTYLNVTAGKGSWLETTGCSGGKWPFQVTTDYKDPNTGATGSATTSGTVRCHS
jgi:hypothetical protein